MLFRSLASLPQLATDLLVHTLHLQLIGHLGLRDYIPAVSGLDYVEEEAVPEGICLGVEGAFRALYLGQS